MYYINNGISMSELPPLPHEQMAKIRRLLPPVGESCKNLLIMKQNLEEKVQKYYYFSFKKSIGIEKIKKKQVITVLPMFDHKFGFLVAFVLFSVNYVLLDPSERKRLAVYTVPMAVPRRVIRAPVPWEAAYKDNRTWIKNHLFTISGIMILLQEIWQRR